MTPERSHNHGEQEGKADFTLLFDDFPNCHVEDGLLHLAKHSHWEELLPVVMENHGVTYRDILKLREFGAKKYGSKNWKASKGTEDHDRFMWANKRSIYRHLVDFLGGELIDPESGCLHLACVALRCMIAIEYGVEEE